MPRRIVYFTRYCYRIVAAELAIKTRAKDFWLTTRLIATSLDPMTIRVALAWASIFWAVLAFPWWFIASSVFERQRGYWLLQLIAPEQVWCFLFVLHGVGVFWRFYDKKDRPNWQLAVNIFGFCLWFFVTSAINYATGSVTPGTALEWIFVALAFWAFILTGKRPEVTSL